MITKEIKRIYARLRANPVAMLVGRQAEMCLRDARAIAEFETLASAGLVRITSEDECENYFDVYGREDNERDQKRMEETIRRMGCVRVVSEWFDGSEWQMADSIGMCVYDRPESPFENCYVVELMREAITAAENHAVSLRDDLALALGEAELN